MLSSRCECLAPLKALENICIVLMWALLFALVLDKWHIFYGEYPSLCVRGMHASSCAVCTQYKNLAYVHRAS